MLTCTYHTIGKVIGDPPTLCGNPATWRNTLQPDMLYCDQCKRMASIYFRAGWAELVEETTIEQPKGITYEEAYEQINKNEATKLLHQRLMAMSPSDLRFALSSFVQLLLRSDNLRMTLIHQCHYPGNVLSLEGSRQIFRLFDMENTMQGVEIWYATQRPVVKHDLDNDDTVKPV